MTYSPAEMIRYNLGELRKHMLSQGCTGEQWRSALLHAVMMEPRPWGGARELFAPRDPENLDPYGAQNHEAPK